MLGNSEQDNQRNINNRNRHLIIISYPTTPTYQTFALSIEKCLKVFRQGKKYIFYYFELITDISLIALYVSYVKNVTTYAYIFAFLLLTV